MVNPRMWSRIPPTMQLPPGPVKENLFHRVSSVSLDVIVIGGGIEGLWAAYNLKQAGHNVRVFEKSAGRIRVRLRSEFRLKAVDACPQEGQSLLSSAAQHGEDVATMGTGAAS